MKTKFKLRDRLHQYIKIRDSTDGYCKCSTCPIILPIDEIQAGHYIPQAQGNSTRYDERNINPQCPECNTSKGGNIDKYTEFMIEKYGQEVIDELRIKSNQIVKMSEADYAAMAMEYEAKIDALH